MACTVSVTVLVWFWNIKLRQRVDARTVELLKSEKTLKQSERLYRKLLHNIQVAVVVHAPNTRVLRCNKKAEEILGLPEAQILNKKADDPLWLFLNAQGDKLSHQEYPANKVLQKLQPLSDLILCIPRPDPADHVWVIVNADPVFDDKGCVEQIIVTFINFTALKQAEEKLKEQTKKLNEILEKAADGICVCYNIKNFPFVRFSHWNPRMIKITGYSLDEINRLGWYQSLYKDLEIRQQAIMMGKGEDIKGEEWLITTKNGEKKHVFISTSIVKKEEDTVHILALMQETTQRKLAEESSHQLRKTESLKRMTGAVAHHFNNLLAIIIGNLELALDDDWKQADITVNLKEAMQGALRASKISGLMLTCLGQHHEKTKPLDLSKILSGKLRQLQTDIPDRITMKTNLPIPGPVIEGNCTQIEHILQTLIMNALEAMDGIPSGKVTISSETVNTSKIDNSHRFPIDWNASEERYACLTVTDTGEGMDEETVGQAFDPFFTKKFTGRGLGLPVALGIVKPYSGCITVKSILNEGSIFSVYFPLSLTT